MPIGVRGGAAHGAGGTIFEAIARMDLLTWAASTGTALVAGVTGSGHCALMCGPLSCAPIGITPRERRRSTRARHIGRLVAYGAVGAVLGTLGGGATAFASGGVRQYLPWLMAAGLVFMALEVG